LKLKISDNVDLLLYADAYMNSLRSKIVGPDGGIWELVIIIVISDMACRS